MTEWDFMMLVVGCPVAIYAVSILIGNIYFKFSFWVFKRNLKKRRLSDGNS